ncbi:MAG TPA: HNH endonuclease signature motif containing protein, partial [Mycobacteriales bacterium]|nr:HNH endonuclease signature motif containing protein [Mycobacteriales bacterium]
MFEVGGIGEQLQQLVTAVRATDGATIPAAGWVDLVEATQQAMNTLTAVQTIALAQLAATDEDLDDAGELAEVYRGLGHHRLDAPDLVSGVLGLTATAAATRVAAAVDLTTRHTPVIEAMAAGRLDAWRASVVADELADASPQACTQVLDRVGDTLGAEPAGSLRRRLRRVLAAVDADAVRRKAARGRAERSLRRTAFGLGTDEWSAKLPVEDSRAAWSVIDTLARSYLTQGRCAGIEQARADALLDLIHARTTGHLDLNITIPASHLTTAAAAAAGSNPDSDRDGVGDGDVLVPVTGFGTTGVTHVRASWLARLAGLTPTSADDPSGCTCGTTGSGTTRTGTTRSGTTRSGTTGTGTTVAACADGTGALATLPIPTTSDSTARRRATRAVARRATRLAQLTTRLQGLRNDHLGTEERRHTTGTTNAVEPYRPPEWMIEYVKTRDGSCRFPGCTTSTRFCDLDHVTAWPTGPTHPDNLACLCRRHHRIKQRPGWHAVLHPDAAMTWTDPTGTRRTTTPADHLQLDTHPDMPTSGPAADTDAHTDASGQDLGSQEVVSEVGSELPSLLEDDLDHLHDHHLIALA